MKNDKNKTRKSEEFTGRDKTRDKTGVKATRRIARKRKASRGAFERDGWQ